MDGWEKNATIQATLPRSPGTGKYQCPGCFKWFDIPDFVEHHKSYDPEIIIFICKKCHIGIHKTKIPTQRKEWLEKKKLENMEYRKEQKVKQIEKRKTTIKNRQRRRRWALNRGRGWGVIP